MNYVLRKLGFYLVALWAAVTLNFVIPRLMPGNPVDILLAKLEQRGGEVDPTVRRSYELLLGTTGDEPLWRQYLDYLGKISQGDLGVSISQYPARVSDVIGQSLPWTVVLVGLATLISFLLGVGLGAVVGWRPGSWLDGLVPVTTLLAAVPYFWLALVLVLIFASTLGWLPVQGGYDVVLDPGWSLAFIGSAIHYGFLPAADHRALLDRRLAAGHAQHDGLDPVRGLHPHRPGQGTAQPPDHAIYAARNAVLPSVAGFAISLGFVVGGSLVTEQVFSYPGIGFKLLLAVQNNDYALMQGIFLVITLAVLGANLLVDLLYGVIDPRTRTSG